MLKLSDLAQRPDFELGPLQISPSRRQVTGPAGEAHVEPLVMQVFLLLLDVGGQVVTRQALFDQVWGGVAVGDDSLNRAIAGVRRIIAETAPGLFEIETIPRTGYRVTGDSQSLQDMGEEDSPSQDGHFSRRLLIGGGAAAVAGIAAGALGLWSIRSREDRQFKELMDRGIEAVEYSDPSVQAGQYFARAIAVRPSDAQALGLLAYTRALRADNAEPNKVSTALQEAEHTARAALAIDPNEPYARLAQITLEQSMLDFAATEDRLREILAIAPDNFGAMRMLWGLLQSTGRSRDALALIERAMAVKPLAAGVHYPWAQLLWILGRTAEADRVIDKATQYWPSHRYVRWARFSILASTGRPRAALSMLDKKETRPQNLSSTAVSLWRISLVALDQRSPESIAAARKANLEAAQKDLKLSAQAVNVLSAVGDIDAAFEIAEAHFAVRRQADPSLRSAINRPPVRSTAWRFAPWLFTPWTAPLRADPRFDALCEGIGLNDYWAKRGIKPDYQLGIT